MTEDQDFVTLSLNNAKVVYAYPKNVFVREGDKAILFYNCDDLGLTLNSTVSGSISVAFQNYYGIPEVKKNADTDASGLSITTSSSTEYDPITVSISDILSGNHKCDLLLIEDVTIETEYKEDGKTVNAYYAVDSNGNRIQFSSNTGAVKNFTEEESVDVICVFNKIQNGVSQIYPVKVTSNGGSVEPGETVVDNIEAFKALSAGTQAKLMLEDALVIFAKGDDAFVRDQSGAIDFYQTGIEFETGQVLNGSIFGELKVFNNMPELIAVGDKTNTDDITFSNGSVTPLTGIDLGEVAAYACELVTVSLTISKEGNYYYGTDEDGNILQIYDKFKIGYNTTDIEGKTFDITGIIIPYKTDFEIAPTEDFVGAPDVTVANIAEFKALNDETTAVLTLTDAQVQLVDASDTRNVYVKDATGGIVFFNSGLTLKNGDILNGTIKAQYKNYNGVPELQKVANSDIVITNGTAVPETMTLSEAASADNLCKLVKIVDVTVAKVVETKDDGNEVVRWFDQNNTIQFYDKQKIGYELQEGNTYTFTGVMTLFNEAPEMIVTVDPTTAGATAISNVNTELNADAPIYNLAGQRVARAEKGIFIQNGKKIILK